MKQNTNTSKSKSVIKKSKRSVRYNRVRQLIKKRMEIRSVFADFQTN